MSFFENCAEKLKAIAVIIMIVVTAAGIILAINLLTNNYSGEFITEDDMLGWVTLLATVLIDVGLYALFVFAEMAEDVSIIRTKFENFKNDSAPSKFLCPSCTKEIDIKKASGDTIKCSNCSRTFNIDQLLKR